MRHLFAMALITALAWGQGVAQGQTMPAFNLPWMNATTPGNTMYDSTTHPGAVFVIEAYFDGCPYCNENAANVNQLAAGYANQALVQVLDVGIDRSRSEYQDWISNHNPNHPVLDDSGFKLIGPLGTTGFPSTYVLDQGLNVVFQHSGVWEDDTATTISQAVASALSHHLRLSPAPYAPFLLQQR